MFKNRQILSFIAHALATVVAISLTANLIGLTNAGMQGSAGAQVGTAIGAAIVAPGIILTWIGLLLGWLGFSLRVPGLSLGAAIVYIVAGVVGILWLEIIFLMPSIVLGFIGWSKEAKAKRG
jgi:hypothetical protein